MVTDMEKINSDSVRTMPYTPERMYKLLCEAKERGSAVLLDSETGELLNFDKVIEFYRSLCSSR